MIWEKFCKRRAIWLYFKHRNLQIEAVATNCICCVKVVYVNDTFDEYLNTKIFKKLIWSFLKFVSYVSFVPDSVKKLKPLKNI